jgi:hypothetical protein
MIKQSTIKLRLVDFFFRIKILLLRCAGKGLDYKGIECKGKENIATLSLIEYMDVPRDLI